MKFFILLMILSITSCGKSPLFNHENESTQELQATSQISSTLYFRNTNLFIKVDWLKGPFPSPAKENQLIIVVQDSFGELLDLPTATEFYLWGWMPSMGHGTADDGFTERLSKGIYIHKELFFNMGGDWDINIELYKNNQSIDSTVIKLEL